MIARRDFITLIGSAAAVWPLAARAQPSPRELRVGLITIAPRTSYAAFDQRLRELGYVDGQNLAVDFLNPDKHEGGVDGATKELVRRKVDVIVAPYDSIVKAALAATDTVPIVMIAVTYDPLALGYIRSLARPGRQVTGLFMQQIELARKRVQLLKDVLPDLQAAMFWDSSSAEQWNETSSAAAELKLRLAGIELHDRPYDYEAALSQAPLDYRRAIIIGTSPVFYDDRQNLAGFALRHRLASMFPLREHVAAGGLLSYGANLSDMFRRAAEYVDRLARGAKAADLPVEQPTKFDLVINFKTAKALGLDMPLSLLAIADEVIE